MLIFAEYNTRDINIIQYSSAKVKHLAQIRIKKEAQKRPCFLLLLHNLFVNFCSLFQFVFAFGSISPSHVSLGAIIVEDFPHFFMEHGVYSCKTQGYVLMNCGFAYSKCRRGTPHRTLLLYYVGCKSAGSLIAIVKQAVHLNTARNFRVNLGLP